MFWKKNKKSDKQKKPKELQASCEGGRGGQSAKSAALRAEALANARAARERIGEETVQKIAAAMAKKQNNAMEQAKARLADADADRVADEILYMLEDKERY